MSGTLYPVAIDDATSLPAPGPNTVTNAGAVTHAVLHDNEILAVQALETKLGTGSSTSTTSTVLRASSNGTSTWGKVVLTSDVTGTLPVANGGTGITSLGTGIATFLGTPSSANLAAAITDETGSGLMVFGTSPNITTPTGIVKGDVGLGNVDNTSDATKFSSPTITTPTIAQINNAVAPGVKIQVRTQTDNSNSIANATTAGVYIQYGWGQVLGTGASTLTDSVTLPTAFTTILGVIINWIGFKTGGAVATDITGFNTAIGAGNIIQTINISTSGFTMSAVSTGTFGAAYHGYSWIAWGI